MSEALRREDDPRNTLGHKLPGIISWGVIALALVGCLFFPRVWLVIATIFLFYFVGRSALTFVFALVGQRKISEWKRRDFTEGEDESGPFGFAPADVRHVVIIPTYKEPAEILRRTLDALAEQHRAAERLIVVLGMEEREPDARAKAGALVDEYTGQFLHAMFTVHPGNLPGEEPGKSSNEAWAGKQARAELDRLGVDPSLTTITSCDADSVLDSKYFSAVAQSFAQEEERHLSFWQAPLFFYNNLWHVPAPVRLSTWMQHAVQLSELAMSFFEPLPISTYTLSMELCERCGFWDPAVIPEDWHAYLNCMFETGEEIRMHSIFLPTLGDATDGDNWLEGVQNRFQQLKRHSWGAEDAGYIYVQLSERKNAWRGSTLFRFFQVLHDHVMRVTSWIFLTSLYMLSTYFSTLHWYDLGWHAAIAQNLIVLNVLFGVGTATLIASMVVEVWRCPPPDASTRLIVVFEIMMLWLILPVVGLYLGMLPALEAQTRLMFGVPITYKVTAKRFVGPATQKA